MQPFPKPPQTLLSNAGKNAQDEHEEYMAKLIGELSDESQGFKTYSQLQKELLRRVDQDKLFDDEKKRAEFKKKEDSVFDRVEQHKLNGEKKLNMFAEQFEKVHGKDHKTFTETWLFEHTGKAIELESVLKFPTFKDFIGVYEIRPTDAYVASKLVIDESDFMGVFDLGCDPSSHEIKNTYEGVRQGEGDFDSAEMEELQKHDVHYDRQMTAHRKHAEKTHENRRHKKHQKQEDSDEDHGQCCKNDAVVEPHTLGDGQYLQFRLRRENVAQYLNNSITAKKLNQLIPDDPMEPVYIFTASANGIMRFHPWGGIARKLWHGYGDSTSTAAFTENLAHAGSFGCFCFGVIYKEKENYTDSTGHFRKGGRTIIMRYNRWATDNVPIYAMVRQRSKNDKSVPQLEQPSTFLQKYLFGGTCCKSLVLNQN